MDGVQRKLKRRTWFISSCPQPSKTTRRVHSTSISHGPWWFSLLSQPELWQSHSRGESRGVQGHDSCPKALHFLGPVLCWEQTVPHTPGSFPSPTHMSAAALELPRQQLMVSTVSVSSTQRCAPRDQPYLLSSLLPAEVKLISSFL